MAPIQRRRFFDTSESEITSGNEEGQELNFNSETFEESSEKTIVSEDSENQETELSSEESATKEKVVISPRLKKRVEKNESEVVKPVRKVVKHVVEEKNITEASNEKPVLENDIKNRDEKTKLIINDLSVMRMHDLRDFATQYGLQRDELAPMKKQELIFIILKAHTDHGGIIFASG
ncbi:MAG: Rho termination factor N-terminal domain-containing protein, partial [Treponemataceae bacterium]|nr:Rho termination factor N-terminal domain-containing protein [Treponemataceae bacterium]